MPNYNNSKYDGDNDGIIHKHLFVIFSIIIYDLLTAEAMEVKLCRRNWCKVGAIQDATESLRPEPLPPTTGDQ